MITFAGAVREDAVLPTQLIATRQGENLADVGKNDDLWFYAQESHLDKARDHVFDAVLDGCTTSDPKCDLDREALVDDNERVAAGEIAVAGKVEYDNIAGVDPFDDGVSSVGSCHGSVHPFSLERISSQVVLK